MSLNTRMKAVYNLMTDRANGTIEKYADDTSGKTALLADDAIRDAVFDILGEDKLTHRGFRNHKNELFTLIETVVDDNALTGLEANPFFERFVEVKNGLLGDKNEFYSEDESTLVATRFAGNHWDTDRKKLFGRQRFTLDTEWIYVHIYDDLERFLKGAVDFPYFISKIRDAMQRGINDRIYTAFNAAGTYLPPEFSKTGAYVESSMIELIQRVQAASGSPVIIAGTLLGLTMVKNGMNTAWIANSQKEENARNGVVLNNIGLGATGAIVIPQSFIRGTFNFKIDDTKVYVLPENYKFIKVFYEGDTRTLELNEHQTHDQTEDIQTQTKVGVACVFPKLFGVYKITP